MTDELPLDHNWAEAREVRMRPDGKIIARRIPDSVVDHVGILGSWLGQTFHDNTVGGWLSVHLLTDDDVRDWFQLIWNGD